VGLLWGDEGRTKDMKGYYPKLEDEYAWATEIQLATLSGICMVKRSALSEITRQRNIAERMLTTCRAHANNITWMRGQRQEFGRVQDILGDKGDSLSETLNRWTQNQFFDDGHRDKWLKSHKGQ